MKVERLESGELRYTYTEKGVARIIPVKNMMHIRGFGLDGVCGMMPMRTGRDVFGAAMAVEESAAKIFENGIQTSGFFLSKDLLTKEQRQKTVKTLTASSALKTPEK